MDNDTSLEVYSTNVTSSDQLLDNSYDEDYFTCQQGLSLFRFVVGVALSLPLAVVGIVGNVFSLVVLCKKQNQGSTVTMLCGLAIADISVLGIGVVLTMLYHLHHCGVKMSVYNDYYGYIFATLFPILHVVRLIDIWLTVLLAVDRWILVCRPSHVTANYNTRKSAIMRMACLCLFSAFVCCPRFFEFKIKTRKDSSVVAITTGLYNDEVYTAVYKITISFLVMYLIPVTSLVTVSALMTRTLKRRENLPDQKKSTNFIVIAIVVIFLMCTLLPMVSQLIYALEIAYPSTNLLSKSTRKVISILSNATVTVNSSVNFIIYCVYSKSFRKMARALCCCRIQDHGGRLSTSSLATTTVMLQPMNMLENKLNLDEGVSLDNKTNVAF